MLSPTIISGAVAALLDVGALLPTELDDGRFEVENGGIKSRRASFPFCHLRRRSLTLRSLDLRSSSAHDCLALGARGVGGGRPPAAASRLRMLLEGEGDEENC